MELWDLYDRNKNPLNKTHIRGERLKRGEYHFVVHILSVNDEGKILITKRSPEKPFGGKWEITGGSAVAGESSVTAAVRELSEETGLKTEEQNLKYCGTVVRDKTNCIYDFYLNKGDFSEKDIVLQQGETVDFKFVTVDELGKMTETGDFLDFVYERIMFIYSDSLE